MDTLFRMDKLAVVCAFFLETNRECTGVEIINSAKGGIISFKCAQTSEQERG